MFPCHMKAIVTKYHGPTDRRGSRISARAEGNRTMWFPYDHEGYEHERAAEAYRDAMGWKGDMVGGGLPDGTGNAFVFVNQ